MSNPPDIAVPYPQPGPKDRLDSWKEIAAYLNRAERTVQRWEREQGLPVHRLAHNKHSSVYAYTAELDTWRTGRSGQLDGEEQAPENGLRRTRALVIAFAAALVLVAALGTWLLSRTGVPAGAWNVRPLTTYPGSEIYPALSPDGSRVAFTWDGPRRDNFDVYLLALDSGVPLRITNTPAMEAGPAWSPDGRWIAFVRLGPIGSPDELYVVPASGGPERRICSLMVLYSPTRNSPLLAWTPDGRHIAVGSQANEAGRASIVLVSLETGSTRPLLGGPKGGAYYYLAPAFSQDGKWLAFARCRPFGACNLCAVELSTDYLPVGETRQLTSGDVFVNSPVWAPSGGHQILFSLGAPWEDRMLARAVVNGLRWPVRIVHSAPGMQIVTAAARTGALVYSSEKFDADLWVLSMPEPGAAAGPMRRIVASTRLDLHPDLSPGGDQIAFASTRSGNTEIWLADRNGANLVQLTRSGERRASQPRWSPDGTRIAFGLQGAEGSAICVVRPSGGLPDCLTDGSHIDSHPTWSRDGASIYFLSDRDGSVQLWKMPAAGESVSPAIQITRNGAAGEAHESQDGREVYYAGLEPGVWRVPAGGGAETLVPGTDAFSNIYAVRDGLYLLTVRDLDSGTLMFLPYGAEKAVAVATVPNPLGSITASADGRTVLFGKVERSESDLMLVRDGRW